MQSSFSLGEIAEINLFVIISLNFVPNQVSLYYKGLVWSFTIIFNLYNLSLNASQLFYCVS